MSEYRDHHEAFIAAINGEMGAAGDGYVDVYCAGNPVDGMASLVDAVEFEYMLAGAPGHQMPRSQMWGAGVVREIADYRTRFVTQVEEELHR